MTICESEVLATGRRPEANSRWVALLKGRITAAGCPSKSRLESWARRGATDVVTLQRGDEMPEWLPAECEELGLSWHHLPISGRRLEAAEDHESLARLPELVEVLRVEGRSLVVHCAAGMHRTGLGLYLIMRHAGLGVDETIELIENARPVTAHELKRSTRRSGCLAVKAEAIFAGQGSIS